MPQLRPDSIFQEWIFTREEDLQSRILPPLFILRLNTLYAELVKTSAIHAPPNDPTLTQEYFNFRAELSGQMALITQLFQDHKAATLSLQENPNPNVPVSQNSELHDLESRAAANLSNPNTSSF